LQESMMRRCAVLLLALWLCACPKRIPELGPGREEEEALECGARLEELNEANPWDPDFPGTCVLSIESCELSQRVCTIASRKPESDSLRRRCAAAQQDCEELRSTCSPPR
jgi:hypothetical protein